MIQSATSNSISPLYAPVLTFIFGAIGGTLLEKFKNRLIVLKKKIVTQLVALSSQSPDWGNIEILYNGALSNTLYTSFIEIKNDSTRDLGQLTVEFSVNRGAAIYKNSGQLIHDEVSKELLLEKAYNDFFLDIQRLNNDHNIQRNEEEELIFQNQIAYVVRHKLYVVPILNRGSKITFNFLIDNANGIPEVNVAIFEKGVKLINEQDAEDQKRKKLIAINLMTSLLFIVAAFPTIKYSSSIEWAVWIMIINSLVVYVVSWILFSAYLFVKKYMM